MSSNLATGTNGIETLKIYLSPENDTFCFFLGGGEKILIHRAKLLCPRRHGSETFFLSQKK